jgi:hypothetical protein
MSESPTGPSHRLWAGDEFLAWVVSLPWVVERPLCEPCVRMFAVDCAPLHRRRLWLLTDVPKTTELGASGVSVILPVELSTHAVLAGWGRPVATLPAGHVLIALNDLADECTAGPLRKLASAAYRYALSV